MPHRFEATEVLGMGQADPRRTGGIVRLGYTYLVSYSKIFYLSKSDMDYILYQGKKQVN